MKRWYNARLMKAGSKYYPLYEFLRAQAGDEPITLTLAEIESILGVNLPQSARRRRGWWSNRSQGAVQAAAWMGAGYHVTEIDLEAGHITFARPTLEYTIRREGDTVLWNGIMIKALRRHMGLTQGELAQELGVRQQTVSEWETGSYDPSRATSKYLGLVAERAGFEYDA